MLVYHEVIRGKLYVCNRRSNVKQPLGDVNNVGLSETQLKAVCDSLNATYKAGYQTSLNQLRAWVDQREVENHAEAKGNSH